MITPALQLLHRLWYQPGALMAAGWWQAADLVQWREVYHSSSLTRPALDRLIRARLGRAGHIPPLSATASAILQTEQRCRVFTLVLGLWQLRAAEYLLLRSHRASLAEMLDDKMLRQLAVLLPPQRGQQDISAQDLATLAAARGASWMAQASDAALAASCLLSEPSTAPAPTESPEPTLKKLLKWL